MAGPASVRLDRIEQTESPTTSRLADYRTAGRRHRTLHLQPDEALTSPFFALQIRKQILPADSVKQPGIGWSRQDQRVAR